ncbi:MAG: SMP-30/gluconolactonase/LRE family protein [Hyphomicrobiaceae bacterium]
MSLYPLPTERSTNIWTRLPDEFRRPDGEPEWARGNRPGQKVHSFLEGPSFDRNGDLYVTDIPYGRIFKVTPQGQWSLVAEYDGWPNGLKIHRDGRVFITDYKHGIMQLDPASGQVTPFLTHRKSESFRGVNDLYFDRKGQMYFTDQGQTGMQDPTGRVYRYNLDTERLDLLLANGPSPNGLVMNPEEDVLYVAMTRGNAVWRVPIHPDGGTSKVSIFTPMAGGHSGADGMAVDETGRLFVCDAGNACVWVFDRDAVPVYRIKGTSDGRSTTNLAFGGESRRSLFITESSSGTILRAELDIAGQPMFSHR